MQRPLASGLLMLLVAGCAAPADPPTPVASDVETPRPLDAGWPPLADAPVRPGAKLFDSLAHQLAGGERLQCTLAFVFADPTNATLYVATASHCVAGFAVGEEIALADGAARGTVAYCSFGTLRGTERCPSLGLTASETGENDFALIAVDAADRAKVHPATLQVGGPSSLAGTPAVGSSAYTYGNSDHRDGRLPGAPEPLDARAGIVDSASAWIVEIVFDVTSVGGDSGSPVLAADGGALGVMQYVLSGECAGPRVDVNGAVLLRPALAFMENATGLRVVLKTWPLLAPPEPLAETPLGCRGGGRATPSPVP